MQDLSVVMPRMLAAVLPVLRENAITPKLVYNSMGNEPRMRGNTIDIPISHQLETRPVAPANVAPAPPAANDLNPELRQLKLDYWYEVPFVLSDTEINQVSADYVPRQLEEAVKALGNEIDKSVLSLYKQVYQHVGTAGTTPFGTGTEVAQNAARMLTTALADKQNRHMVLDEFAYANALGLPVLQRVNESGSSESLREGRITRVLGFDWHENQNVLRHTTSALTSAGAYVMAANAAAGATTITIDNGASAVPSSPLAVGDVFTFANHDQQYVVKSYTAATASATVTIEPKLVVAVPDNTNLNVVSHSSGGYTVSLAFHRDAFAFASRPLADIPDPNQFISMTDPVTGITMRLEMVRQHKRTYFSLDCLWGVTVLRPELAVRIHG